MRFAANFCRPLYRIWPLANCARRDYCWLSQREKDSILASTNYFSKLTEFEARAHDRICVELSLEEYFMVSEFLRSIISGNITKLKSRLISEFDAELRVKHPSLAPWSVQNNGQTEGINNSPATTGLLLRPRHKGSSLPKRKPCPLKNSI